MLRLGMAYQPRINSPRRNPNEFKKPLRERRKDKKRSPRNRHSLEEKLAPTVRDASEATLKRLHTLGNQKFGSSPFSQHFDRWITIVEIVLAEFEAHPDITVDEQYVKEREQALAVIKLQLEERRKKEATLEQEIKNCSDCKINIKKINAEYAKHSSTIRARKRSKLKRLYATIEDLKKEQEIIVQLKAGFFRGLSKKEKEQKEIAIAQEIDEKQRALELVLLEYSVAQKTLREEYERKREPEVEQLKVFRKNVESLETDGSLEERWFACEALIDAVNSFLQRSTGKLK
jgi:hypothetical protein